MSAAETCSKVLTHSSDGSMTAFGGGRCFNHGVLSPGRAPLAVNKHWHNETQNHN